MTMAQIVISELEADIDRLEAENKRLRAGGCIRDQRTTQYCAEAVALSAERDCLRRGVESVIEKYSGTSESPDMFSDVCHILDPVDKAYWQPRPRTPDELENAETCDHLIGIDAYCEIVESVRISHQTKCAPYFEFDFCPECGEKLEASE